MATKTPTAQPTPFPSPDLFPSSRFAAIVERPVSDERAATYEAILDDIAGGAGITATVLGADGTWSGAAGKADGVHDVAVDSQFGIGSITKSIVAAQVMLLVEAGQIELDRRATDYLPTDFWFDTNGATIRQLLTHRSGLPDTHGDVEADRGRVWTTDDALRTVPASRGVAGMIFRYADTNYHLLGLVIEHVTGRPLAEVLRSGALAVAGTDRLVYQPAEKPTPPLAMPLGESPTTFEKGLGYLPSMSDASSAGPAGALASDSISLARWWRAFCAGEIVSRASLTEMATLDRADGYGLGLINQADPWGAAIGHTGGNFGFSAWAGCMTRTGNVIVVLTNRLVDDLGGLPRPLVEAAGG